MRLTRAGEYAVRTILYMARKPVGTIVKKKEIASEMDIPEEFLAKIAVELKRAGIIEIVQGSKGGYVLLISPHELSLLRVVEAITGQIFLNDCIIRRDACKRSEECTVYQVWKRATEDLRKFLGNVSFQDLLSSGVCLEEKKDYEEKVP